MMEKWNVFKAIDKGDEKELKTLIKSGHSPNLCLNDDSKTSALIRAVIKGQEGCLLCLIRCGASLDYQDRHGSTALIYAAHWGQLGCLKILLSRGADPSISENDGTTPLMCAACWGHMDCLKCLVSHNISINRQDKEGRTALIHAVKEGREDCVAFLMKCKADFDIPDTKNCTALAYAILHRQFGCVHRLLEVRSKLNYIMLSGKTPLTMAMEQRCGDDRFVEKLLLLGARMNLTTIDQMYMHEMIARGKQKIVQLMIMRGCVPILRKCRERFFPFSALQPVSPFCVALLSNRLNIARYLIAINFLTGYDVNTLPHNKEVWQQLRDKANTDAQALLGQLASQPCPLVKLCLISISASMGSSPNRELRVKELGLPHRFQTILLFQEPLVHLCFNQWPYLPSVCDDKQYNQRPQPRPLAYNWPVGHRLDVCDCNDCYHINGVQVLNIQESRW